MGSLTIVIRYEIRDICDRNSQNQQIWFLFNQCHTEKAVETQRRIQSLNKLSVFLLGFRNTKCRFKHQNQYDYSLR